MQIDKLVTQKALLFDGAMGTMLQQRGLPIGGLPELYNLTHPAIVREIHTEYVAAGADIITANTFQASEFKLPLEYPVKKIVTAGVTLAKESGAPYVALDIGPLGQLLAPMGTLSFAEAYEQFTLQMQAGEAAGADVILIETIADLLEAKIAILAAKEQTNLPVICTLTFQEDGRTFVGCDPTTAVLTLQGLGVDALGVNCSLGPKELLPIVEQILTYASVPVIVQANAGLPLLQGEQTVYPVGALEYAEYAKTLLEQGVSILGGCCGTTPDYIRKLDTVRRQIPPKRRSPRIVSACTSGTQTVLLDDGIAVIGERINPTGKKKLKEAILNRRIDYILQEAILQTQAGSDILDVNVGLPDIDEAEMITKVIEEIQGVVPVPLQIDSSDVRAIEAGARHYNGKPIINSVNGKQESMDAVFPLVKKYGALVVCLTLDEAGIPETAEGRFAIAQKIMKEAETYGIGPENLLIDCLVLTASAQQQQVRSTLDAIKLVKSRLGLKTVLGVSNVSFGLPQREIINSTFLAAAFGAGLDVPILNPLAARYKEVVDSYRVLNYQDIDAVKFIATYADAQTAPIQQAAPSEDLVSIILEGRKGESAPKVEAMLAAGLPPLEIINKHFIPALDTVGEGFETGRIFLPQLIQSAETVKNGFEVIKRFMEQQGKQQENAGKVLVATVKGDIHDIGKNIVKMVLENYGYEVFDLGKDVPAEDIIATAQREQISLIGLSALMTTTVKNMKEIIAALREAGWQGSIMVGGAVLNPEYAAFVKADYYVKNALESVAVADRLLQG